MADLAKVKLNLPASVTHADTSIVVNGEEIRAAVKGVTVEAKVGYVTTVTLELPYCEAELDGEMRMHMPKQTRALLIAYGWTPPSENADFDVKPAAAGSQETPA